VNRKEDDHTMKHQAIRPVALMLSVLLIAAVPAQAGTITYGDVIALATINGQSGRSSVDLRLRSVTQQQSGGTSSQDRQTVSGATQQQDRKNIQTPTGGSSAGGADSSITGTTVPAQQPGSVQVETIELGDIQGTICDCGEIFTPKGGFPKLPLLALAGIPLLFLGGGNDIIPPDDVFPTPTPPPPPQVPEPATLLLLGSGLAALGAGARRRRAARSNDERDEVLEVRGA
jgi:hypothetical protein